MDGICLYLVTCGELMMSGFPVIRWFGILSRERLPLKIALDRVGADVGPQRAAEMSASQMTPVSTAITRPIAAVIGTATRFASAIRSVCPNSIRPLRPRARNADFPSLVAVAFDAYLDPSLHKFKVSPHITRIISRPAKR